MSIKIVCINKEGGNHYDPHEAITNLGWVNSVGGSGKATRLEMVDFVKKNPKVAYVSNGISMAYLIAKISPKGNPYVKTISNGIESDNLLALPECRA